MVESLCLTISSHQYKSPKNDEFGWGMVRMLPTYCIYLCCGVMHLFWTSILLYRYWCVIQNSHFPRKSWAEGNHRFWSCFRHLMHPRRRCPSPARYHPKQWSDRTDFELTLPYWQLDPIYKNNLSVRYNLLMIYLQAEAYLSWYNRATSNMDGYSTDRSRKSLETFTGIDFNAILEVIPLIICVQK